MRTADKTKITTSHLKGSSVQADFQKEQFDILFRDKGYNVIHEKAIMCSCKSKEADHLSSCANCGGTGWFFVNPTKTRMIITGMQLDKEYEETARKDLGMVNITAKHEDKLGFMDKIILEDAVATHHQVIHPTLDSTSGFYVGMLIYDIKEIEYIGKYLGQTGKLDRLVEGTDFSYSNNILQFASNFEKVNGASTNAAPSATQLEDTVNDLLVSGIEGGDVINNVTDGSTAKVTSITDSNTLITTALTGGTLNVWTATDVYQVITTPKISIRYRHAPVFYVWDIARDALVSLLVKGQTKRDPVSLAVRAIGKRAHLIADAENLAGDRLLDNSWLPACPDPVYTKAEQIIRNTSMTILYSYLTDLQKHELFDVAIAAGDVVVMTSNVNLYLPTP